MSDRRTRLIIEVDSALPTVEQQLERLIQLDRQLLEATNQANLSARTGQLQQIEAINAVSAALESQRVARGRANNEASQANKEMEKQMAGITSNLKSFTGMVASAFAITEIKSFGEGVIEAKTKIDAIHLSLETMLGSKKEADELYTRVVALAKTTPYSLEEIGNQVVKLKAYNIETADLIPTITALGNIAAAVGKEKLPQLTLAYGQVATTGKLMGDELNQFREVGLPVLDLIGKSYGKTSAEVQKMAADHQISFTMVRKAILDASADGGRYQDLMVKLSRTVGGEVANLSDAFEVAKGKIGDFFEDQISGGTARLKGLIESLIGSSSAIQRTLTTIESAAAGYTTWKVAMNSAAAQQLVVNAATKATEVVMGTYNLMMISLKGTTEGFTRAQQESAVASRTMWSTLSANPIGAVLTLVGLVTTAYMAWKAATTEVTNELGENELKLKDEQAQLNTLTEAAMSAAQGTKERKDAIELLIQKYPQYFSGLNSEKTSNTQLKEILDKVNGSYQQRIALARQAYNLDAIAEKRKELFQFEKDFFDSLPKDIGDRFNNDIVKFNEALNAGNATATKLKAQLNDFAPGGAEFFGGVVKNATEKFKVVEESYNKTTKTIQQIETDSAKALVEAENTRWKNQQANLDKGTKAYQAAEKEHLDNLAKLNGTYRENELKQTITHQEQKKNVLLVSDKEWAVIKKANNEANQVDRLKELQDELDLINKREEQDKEAIRKRVVNKNISNAQLAALQEQARKQLAELDARADAERAKVEAEIEKEKQARFLKSSQEIADKSQVLIKQRMEAERVLTLLNDAKTNEQRVAALREYNETFELGLKEQAAKELKIQLDASKKVLDDLIAKNGEKGDEYRKAYERWLRDNQQYNAALTTQTVTAAKETAEKLKNYEKEIQQANQETAQLDQETLQVQAKSRKEIIGLTLDLLGQQSGMVGQASSAIKAVMGNIDSLSAKALKAAEEGVTNANIYLNNIKTTYEEGTAQGDAAIAHANQRVADSNNTLAKAQAAADAAFLGIVSTGIQVVLALASAVRERMAEACQAAAESMGKLRDVFKDLYGKMAETSRESYEQQMEAAKGNTQQQLAIIDDFYKKQDELASSSVRIDAEVAYHQKFFELRGEQKKMLLWWEQDKQDALYRDQARAAQEMILIQASIDELERQKLKAKEVHDTKIADIDEYQRRFKDAVDERIDKLNEAADLEIESVNKVADKKIAALNDEIAEKRQAYEADVKLTNEKYEKDLAALRLKETAARAELQATYDLKQQLLEQSTNDEIEKIGIIDRARNETLERYRVDQVDMLTATRDRILATLTDEGERTRVTNEYAERIKQVHTDVEAAKLDKTKGVSLATTQIRKEEKETATKLKEEEKTALSVLEQNFQTLFEKLSDDKDNRLEKLKADTEKREGELKDRIEAIQKQAKSDIEALQTELKNTIVGLQNQVKQNEADAAIKKKIANAEYTNAVIAMNRQLFEAHKAMKVAEIESEIAILNAQKSWTGIGNGKINEAIGQLQQAISKIQGLSAGGQEVAVDGGYTFNPDNSTSNFNLDQGELQYIVDMNKAGGRDKISLRNGTVGGPSLPVREDTLTLLPEGQEVGLYRNGKPATFTFDVSGKRVDVVDANGKPVTVAFARGFIPSTGESFFKGTDFVEGLGYPDGRDTVPAMVNKGERIIPTVLNEALGGKALSNEQLVDHAVGFKRFKEAFPEIAKGMSAYNDSGFNRSIMKLPDSIMKDDREAKRLDRMEKAFSRMDNTLSNLKQLHITMDEHGFTKSIITQMSKTIYKQSLMTR